MSRGMLAAGGPERYTQPRELDPVRESFGGFDLDPCSCATANRHVQAAAWCGLRGPFGDGGFHVDGLTVPWANRVWVNPPGMDRSKGERKSPVPRWWAKAWDEIQSGRVKALAFLFFSLDSLRVVGADTSRPFPLEVCSSLWLFERPEFFGPDGGPILGPDGKPSQPAHPSVIILWGQFNPAPLRAIGRLVQVNP